MKRKSQGNRARLSGIYSFAALPLVWAGIYTAKQGTRRESWPAIWVGAVLLSAALLAFAIVVGELAEYRKRKLYYPLETRAVICRYTEPGHYAVLRFAAAGTRVEVENTRPSSRKRYPEGTVLRLRYRARLQDGEDIFIPKLERKCHGNIAVLGGFLLYFGAMFLYWGLRNTL